MVKQKLIDVILIVDGVLAGLLKVKSVPNVVVGGWHSSFQRALANGKNDAFAAND